MNKLHAVSVEPDVQTVPVRPDLSLEVAVYRPENCEAGGASVMLLHGGGQNRHSWHSSAKWLAAKGVPVMTYDARGHGKSGWAIDGDYSLEALAEDLMAVRRLQGWLDGPVVGVGASMGGQTLLRSHRLGHANTWAAVVLVDISTRPESGGVRRIIDFMKAQPEGFASLEDVATTIGGYNSVRQRQGGALNGLLKVVRLHDDGRWRWLWDPAFIERLEPHLDSDPAWQAFIDDLGLQMRLDAQRVTAPTLLVRGMLSDVVSEEGIADDIGLIPHAQVARVPGAGHMVAGDNNQVFAQAIHDFLQSLRSV